MYLLERLMKLYTRTLSGLESPKPLEIELEKLVTVVEAARDLSDSVHGYKIPRLERLAKALATLEEDV
jgi:hypothetical protein